MISAALRSPNLPLDALRSRIKESVNNVEGGLRSEVDSVLLGTNLAVAYVNIDEEEAARSVGTTLWLDQSEQRTLIEAGYRQTIAALGGKCTNFGFPETKSTKGPGDSGIHDPCSGSSGRGTIEFNTGLSSQRREDLSEALSRSLQLLSSSVGSLSSSIESTSEEHRRSNEATIERAFVAQQLKIELKRDDARAYASSVKELNNGADLVNASDNIARYYVELKKREPANSVNFKRFLDEAASLACATDGVLVGFGFRAYQNRGPFYCPNKPTKFNKDGRQRLQALEASAEHLLDKCRKVSGSLACRYYIDFQKDTAAARSAYLSALRPAHELITSVPAAEAPVLECKQIDRLADLSAEIAAIAVTASTLHLRRTRDTMVEEARLRSTIADAEQVIGQVPRGIGEVRPGCSAIFANRANSDRFDPILDQISIDAEGVKCLLRVLPVAWPANGDRVRSEARLVFEAPDTEAICGTQITVVPGTKPTDEKYNTGYSTSPSTASGPR